MICVESHPGLYKEIKTDYECQCVNSDLGFICVSRYFIKQVFMIGNSYPFKTWYMVHTLFTPQVHPFMNTQFSLHKELAGNPSIK